MTTRPSLALLHWGASTPIGARAADSALAFRAGAVGIRECPLMDLEGKATTFASSPLLDPYLMDAPRAIALIHGALHDLFEFALPTVRGQKIKVFLLIDEENELPSISSVIPAEQISQFVRESVANLTQSIVQIEISTGGSAGIGALLTQASLELDQQAYQFALVCAVHTDYSPQRIKALSEHGRLYSRDNLDALMPAEAAISLLLSSAHQCRQQQLHPQLLISAPHSTHEKARWNNDESASEAAGLTVAARNATEPLHAEGRPIGWISTDASSELFRCQELQSVLIRLQSRLGAPQVLDLPCQRLGYLGAASGPWQLLYAAEAFLRSFAPAPDLLCLLGSESGTRTAFVASCPEGRQSY